jgi:phage terminase large subunit-like protein
MTKKDSRVTMGDLSQRLGQELGKVARRPNANSYEAQPKQRTFHSSEDKIRLFLGGNRSGKTTSGVLEDIYWAKGSSPYRKVPEGPNRIRVIGVDFPNGIQKILLPEFARWCPPSILRGHSWSSAYSPSQKTLYFDNDSFIEFMSADQELDAFAGTSRHLIHFDEEPPGDVFNENKARTIDTAGAVILTMTPLLGLTWVYDDIYMKKDEEGITVVEVSMDENEYLAKTEVDAFLQGLNAEERKARGEGKFTAIGGLIFKEFSPETHVIPPMIPPLSWEWYVSLDHGINNPTAILWHGVSPDGNIVTFSESYASDLTIEQHATTIHAREAHFGRTPDYRVIDPACRQRQAVTGDSIIAEYAKLDLHFIPGNNDVAVGISKMRSYLALDGERKPRWYITEDCPNFIKEMQRYRYATYLSSKVASRSNLQEQPVKKDDHAIDSARYFITLMPDLQPVAISPLQAATAPPKGYDQLLYEATQNSLNPYEGWEYEYGS